MTQLEEGWVDSDHSSQRGPQVTSAVEGERNGYDGENYDVTTGY